jgi:hypothetical protein
VSTPQSDWSINIASRVLTSKVDETVRNFSFLKTLGPPPERNYHSYFNWIWRKKPLGRGYDDYIFHESDFVSILGNRSNYFEELVRCHITKWRGSPLRVSNSLSYQEIIIFKVTFWY